MADLSKLRPAGVRWDQAISAVNLCCAQNLTMKPDLSEAGVGRG